MKRLCLSLLWLTVTSLFLGQSVAQTTAGLPLEAADWTTTACATSNCAQKNGLVCRVNNAGVKLCRCDVEHRKKMKIGVCHYMAVLGEVCGANHNPDPAVTCSVPDSVCAKPRPHEGRLECMCKSGMLTVDNVATGAIVTPVAVYKQICAKELKQLVPGDTNLCNQCNAVGSKCYAMPTGLGPPITYNKKRDGCKCDISFSGDTCHKSHVKVACDFQNKTMKVCYTPHSDVTSTAEMHADKQPEGSCQSSGKLTSDVEFNSLTSSKCPKGSYLLVFGLPTSNTTNTCGTEEHSMGALTRFDNTIVVQKNSTPSGGSIAFTVYCLVGASEEKTIGGFQLKRYPSNNRGQHNEAKVGVSLLTDGGQYLGNSPIINVNDKIKIRINVSLDGTYGAVSLESAFISPASSSGDTHGPNVVFYSNGCPVDNRMKMAREAPESLMSNGFKLLKPRTGKGNDIVYFHFKMRLCLVGNEDDCKHKTAAECSNRRKRSVEDGTNDEETLDMRITLVSDDPNAAAQGKSTITMTTLEFSVVIVLLLALILISVVVVILLVFKLRSRGTKVDDNVELSTNKPQRFALPRVARNNMRI